MTRIIRLAQIIENKYHLGSTAQVSEDRIVKEVKKGVIDAYNLYVNPQTAKDPIFQIVANMGQPLVVKFVDNMNKMVGQIDRRTSFRLINDLNKILGMLYQMKNDPGKTIRNFIHDNMRGFSEPQRNERERHKSKFEVYSSRLFGLLQKLAVKLQIIVPDVAVHGGTISPQRKELPKSELLMFIQGTPAFQSYGLDSKDIMEKILLDYNMRNMITTLINAVKRRHVPIDGQDVYETAKEIKEMLDEQSKNNQEIFEAPEEKFQQIVNAPEVPPSAAPPSSPDVETDPAAMKAKMEQEDAEKAKRQQEWEEQMKSKYSSRTVEEWLKRGTP